MKRNNRWKAVILLAAATLLGGCSLAREEVQPRGTDKLVGVFLTEEYLDTGALQLEADWKGEVGFGQEEKIPGKMTGTEDGGPEIVFEGIEGYGIYSVDVRSENGQMYEGYTFTDEIFSELHIKESDNGTAMEASVYVEREGVGRYYFNPVYQTAKGEVYLQPGHGLTAEVSGGMSMSQKISAENKMNKNGEEITETREFEIRIEGKKSDVPVRILFLDEANNIIGTLEKRELAELLEKEQRELSVPAGTAYLIAEQQSGEGETIRAVRNRGEESLSFFKSQGNGYLAGDGIMFIWE